MKDFAEFGAGVLLGLGKAATSDVDVFLLAASCFLPENAARAVRLYTVYRRLDQYVGLVNQRTSQIIHVMDKTNA